MNRCRWCPRVGHWPVVCMSTRDMEDRAIDGDVTCYAALAREGGGERGMRYVDLNRKTRKEPKGKSWVATSTTS